MQYTSVLQMEGKNHAERLLDIETQGDLRRQRIEGLFKGLDQAISEGNNRSLMIAAMNLCATEAWKWGMTEGDYLRARNGPTKPVAC